MKKIFRKWGLALLLGFSISQVNAQEVNLEGITERGFTGVHVIPGKGYYTCFFGEKTKTKGMANFKLYLYDLDLQQIAANDLEISKNSELLASAATNDAFFFSFADISAKTATYITLDGNGKQIQKKVFTDIKPALLTAANAPLIYPIGNDFVMVKRVKEKKTGYVLERYDRELNQKYTVPYTPEKGSWDYLNAEVQGDKLYLIRQGKQSSMSDAFDNAIVSYDLNTGKEAYSYSMFDGADSGFPTFLRTDDKGNVYTGGMYFNGQKFDEKNSDGLFYLILNPTGAKDGYSKTSWKSVADKMRGEYSSALLGGKTKTLVQDMVRNSDGTYSIITETFRKSNNSELTGAGALRTLAGGGKSIPSKADEDGFTVMDFVIFTFDQKGNFANMTKLEKPVSEIIVKGSAAGMKGLEMALLMDAEGFFNYKYLIEHNGKPYIVYSNMGGGLKEMAYFMPVDAKSTSGLAAIDLDPNYTAGLNNVAKISSAINGPSRTYNPGDTFSAGGSDKWQGIKPAKPGYMLLYKTKQVGKLRIWLEKVPISS